MVKEIKHKMISIYKSSSKYANSIFARPFTIRHANASDKPFVIDSILDLVKIGENLKSKPSIAGIDKKFDEMINDPKRCAIFIAEDNNKKLGAAVVTFHEALHMGGQYAYLEELIISYEARGTGVGSKLLKWIEEDAKQRGMMAVHLSQPPATSLYNTERNKFYEKNGYLDQNVSRVKFFKPWFKVE